MAAPGPAAWTFPATIPYFSGEHDMELIDLFVTTNVRACNHFITAYTGIAYNEFNYFDEYAITNMDPSVVAWHVAIMNNLHVQPATPAEGVAAWWATQFYQRWMPRNVTNCLHQEMAALLLGNSLEDYIRLLQHATYGLYLVQALQNFMTMRLTIGQAVTWPLAVVCVRNAAASRNLVDGYLTTPARAQAKAPARFYWRYRRFQYFIGNAEDWPNSMWPPVYFVKGVYRALL
ncbi:hypothetical protein DFJ77DRAFT_515112 [Powellomyces hirtus]|nr:hypothetical protein DFJ77DRAFT_515112 [Powellomyces hirtus]